MAIQLDQVEGVEHYLIVVGLAVKLVQVGPAVPTADHRLAVQDH